MGITVTNLTKTYGSQQAVDDISFEVKTGEILGFLGPNGAGKSTTMKIITCYIQPNSGNVTLDDYNIYEHANEVKKKIGYLPENNPLYLDMSIVDYLSYTAALQGVEGRDIKNKVRNMIHVTGLERERHKLIGELSKGYRQRVGLAQALIHDPEVLILDEPTTGLDPNQIVEIRELIKTIGKQKTVLLSSHILKEVEATCDRILIISQGKLVANGTTEELRKQAQGADQVFIEIDSNDENIGDTILNLSGTSSLKPHSLNNANGWLVDAKPNADVRKELFDLCVKNSWNLRQLTPIHSSLEDIFRELTKYQEA